jgi:GYD domain
MAEGLGGRLESFYFAFGETDAYVVLDLPDNRTAAAASIAVNTVGGATSEVVVLRRRRTLTRQPRSRSTTGRRDPDVVASRSVLRSPRFSV